MSALDGFTLSQEDFSTFGTGLTRPECVWIDADGIWVSDARGGVAKASADGPPELLGSGIQETNGFSRRADGVFLAAGLSDGTLHAIKPDGETSPLLRELDSVPLGTVNHAWADKAGRIWVSMMTRRTRWHEALCAPPDGYIVRIDERGPVIVADGLHLTNEVKTSPDGKFVYAAESLASRIVRFPIRADGSLGAKETAGPQSLGRGAFLDGFTFDEEGNIWVIVISRNGLSVITRDGDLKIVYEDAVEPAIDKLLAKMAEGTADQNDLAACLPPGPVKLPTSIAFGGKDGRTAFIGSLPLPHLVTFRAPVGAAKY